MLQSHPEFLTEFFTSDAGGDELDEGFITLLFVDVVQSTELTERLGDREAYRRVCRVLGCASRCAHEAGGEVLELRGDGLLIAFDDVADGLRCGAEILARLDPSAPDHLALRLGLHAGSAARTPTGYFGSTVILAARLSDSAAPDELLVSESVRKRARGWPGGFDAGRRVKLKGFAGTHRVFRASPRPRMGRMAETGSGELPITGGCEDMR